MNCSIHTVAGSLVVVGLLTGAASAATSWTVPSGSSTTIDYSAGQTANGLFTDSSPNVADNTFLFFPTGFEAGTEGNPFTADTLSFVLTAKPGQALSHIAAGLNGDWSLLGLGSVNATGTLKITNLATSAVLSNSLIFTPTLPTSNEDGTFSGLGEIDLPAGWVNAKVELTAEVSVGGVAQIAQDNFTGLIQLKGADVGVETKNIVAAVPLPGALAIAPFAFGLAWLARRRMAK